MAAAYPCLPLSTRGANPVAVASETAVIVWDPETKTEHFIRTATFSGDGKPIGFLVPTPTPPKLRAIDDDRADSAGELERLIAPKTLIRRQQYYRLSEDWNIFPAARSASKSSDHVTAGAATAEAKDVDVLSQGDVGGYRTAVLKATDTQSLIKWLKQNRFESDARLEPWLAPYIEKGWAITAFRFQPTGPGFMSDPVCLTFKTDRPFYPYREPRAIHSPASRTLRVFLITPERMKGELDSGPWSTSAEHSGSMRTMSADYLADGYDLPKTLFRGRRLTSFLDRMPVRPESELFFVRDTNQQETAVPPVVRVVEDPIDIPKGAVAIAAGVGALILLKAIPRRRRRSVPA